MARSLATPNLVAHQFVKLLSEVDLRKVTDALVGREIDLEATIEWNDVVNC